MSTLKEKTIDPGLVVNILMDEDYVGYSVVRSSDTELILRCPDKIVNGVQLATQIALRFNNAGHGCEIRNGKKSGDRYIKVYP